MRSRFWLPTTAVRCAHPTPSHTPHEQPSKFVRGRLWLIVRRCSYQQVKFNLSVGGIRALLSRFVPFESRPVSTTNQPTSRSIPQSSQGVVRRYTSAEKVLTQGRPTWRESRTVGVVDGTLISAVARPLSGHIIRHEQAEGAHPCVNNRGVK